MIGNTILNYKIISLIGKGGMGSVYLAEHTLISNEKVAIKVINANIGYSDCVPRILAFPENETDKPVSFKKLPDNS